MVSFRAIASLLCIVSVAFAQHQGSILEPKEYSAIAPGESFVFDYDSVADYSVSSYNYSVFLFTDPPTSFSPSGAFAQGYFFGRYDYPNYPAVPYPTHPAPTELIMPDFSQDPSGWGSGASADNATVWLTVIEEYATGNGVLGFRMSLATTPIMYNGTVA